MTLGLLSADAPPVLSLLSALIAEVESLLSSFTPPGVVVACALPVLESRLSAFTPDRRPEVLCFFSNLSEDPSLFSLSLLPTFTWGFPELLSLSLLSTLEEPFPALLSLSFLSPSCSRSLVSFLTATEPSVLSLLLIAGPSLGVCDLESAHVCDADQGKKDKGVRKLLGYIVYGKV